jgi:hypothetical protein
MESVYILIVAGLTSVAAYILGITRLRFSRSGLWRALGRTCECVGLTLVFFLLNLAVGMLAILAVRSLTGRFVSLYIITDILLLVLSLLQAMIFQAWQEGSRPHHTSESRGNALLPREP